MVVLRVVEGGVADKGGVRAGMQLVGLNSTSLRGIPTPEALNMIKNSSRPLVLEFAEVISRLHSFSDTLVNFRH